MQTITTFSGILETVLAVIERQEDKNSPLNKQIDDIVSQCNKNIDALSIELKKFEPYPQTAELRTKIKSRLRKFYYPFREGTLTGLRDTVQEARSNLMPAMQALQLDKSLNIKADTQDNKALLASQLDKLGILERGTQDANASLTSIGNGELPELVELLIRMADSKDLSDLLRNDVRVWLGAPDPSINQNAASKKCQKATGSWFVQGPQFLYWKDRPNAFLWLHGFTGCGKTILCSTIVNNIYKHTASLAHSALAFYYFDFSNQIKAQASSCLRSIVLQIAQRSSDITALNNLHRVYATGTPPSDELLEVLRQMLQSFQRVYIVLDALDECTEQEELFDLLTKMRLWHVESLCILVTSRDEPDIRNALNPTKEQEALLQNSSVDEDIVFHIAETLKKDRKLQEWSEMFPEIEESLTKGAKGMFRWVDCQLQTLRGCPSRTDLRETLKHLPESLDKTYERILRRVPQKHCHHTLRALQWLCIADEPVRMESVMDLFSVRFGHGVDPQFDSDARFNSPEKVLGLCPGFIIGTTKYDMDWHLGKKIGLQCFQIAHYSVKEYLLSDRVPRPPDPISMFTVDEGLANLAMAKTCLVFALHGHHNYEHPNYSNMFRAESLKPSIGNWLMWPTFFRNAKEEPQMIELAIEYLTRKNGHSVDGSLVSAMSLACSEGLDSVITWLVDHHRADIDLSDALMQVCISRFRSIKTVKFLIENGAAVNGLRCCSRSSRRKGSSPLHEAAEFRDFPLVQTLVQLGADLRQKDTFGMTPSFRAAYHGCPPIELIELLWCQDSSFSHNRREHNTLHLIADLHDDGPPIENVARWLIDHGVDPYHKDNEGYTPLHAAAGNGNESAIKVLVAATGKHSNYDGCLMRYFTITRRRVCRLSTTQQLFAVDPNPNGDFGRGGGALYSLLLEFHLDIDRRACRPGTLFYARKINALLLEYKEDHAPIGTKLDVQFLEVLLKEYPADDYAVAKWLAIELKERDPEFLGIELWGAAVARLSVDLYDEKRGREVQKKEEIDEIRQMIRILFRKREMFGVDLAQLYRFLHQALRRKNEYLAETLIREEPDCLLVRLQEDASLSGRPLHHAACWGRKDLVRLMLDSGADPDEKDENGKIALLTAFQGRGQFLNRILLKHGCNVNYQNYKGHTALMYAVILNEVEIVELLLEKGCDVGLRNNEGYSAIDLARQFHENEIVKLLEEHGRGGQDALPESGVEQQN